MSKETELLEKYVGKGISEKVAKELISGDNTPTKKYAQAMITHHINRKNILLNWIDLWYFLMCSNLNNYNTLRKRF